MSLDACAGIVRRGDPDRFLAAMATPVADRAVLFPIYAFNVEIARAPWVASEPAIAEIRLQWWRDALDEISSGGNVRRHEVVTPLASVLDADGARLLDDLILARRWDVYNDPFADAAEFSTYLDRTAGNLVWSTARASGVTGGEAAIRDIAWASGLANMFLAVPELVARGRNPLIDPDPQSIRDLAGQGLRRLASAEPGKRARAALMATWRAKPLLKRAVRNPGCVLRCGLRQAEISRRAGLILRTLRH